MTRMLVLHQDPNPKKWSSKTRNNTLPSRLLRTLMSMFWGIINRPNQLRYQIPTKTKNLRSSLPPQNVLNQPHQQKTTSRFTLSKKSTNPSSTLSSSSKASAPKKKGRPSYLTKAERRLDKLKQKAKRTEKADDEKIKRKMSGGAGGRNAKQKVSRGKKGQRGPGALEEG